MNLRVAHLAESLRLNQTVNGNFSGPAFLCRKLLLSYPRRWWRLLLEPMATFPKWGVFPDSRRIVLKSQIPKYNKIHMFHTPVLCIILYIWVSYTREDGAIMRNYSLEGSCSFTIELHFIQLNNYFTRKNKFLKTFHTLTATFTYQTYADFFWFDGYFF